MLRSISLSVMRAQAWTSDLVSKVFAGLDSPYGEFALPTASINGHATIPDYCHFDHSRHVQVWQIRGKNDFQD